MVNIILETTDDLEVLMNKYREVSLLIEEYEAKDKIIKYVNALNNKLNEFKDYFNSEQGKTEISLENNLISGYYHGTFETEETLLSAYYLDKTNEIKSELFDALDDQTKRDYEVLEELRKQKFECELSITDAPYELGLSEEETNKYLSEFKSIK